MPFYEFEHNKKYLVRHAIQYFVAYSFGRVNMPVVLLPCPGVLTDPGRVLRRWHPKGSRFFHFDIQNFQNITVSGVNAPLTPTRLAPPTGPATKEYLGILLFVETLQSK